MRGDSRKFIESLFEPGKTPYVSLEGLTDAQYQHYVKEAKQLLNSPVFENEVNKVINDTILTIGKHAKNFDEVIDLRASINGLLALKENLEEIVENGEQKPQDLTDAHAPI